MPVKQMNFILTFNLVNMQYHISLINVRDSFDLFIDLFCFSVMEGILHALIKAGADPTVKVKKPYKNGIKTPRGEYNRTRQNKSELLNARALRRN